ncbi:MAG: hypothetical protein Athens101410_516 [Parcubacteria group bacterium Athens1014_10]|nr:MAG: hypothetical protein Athens101410_516 [Parcubacteria group bacterium Athens1014_10]TSD05442.1 MAG: hypothetical protein Athens071412_351 [Parcubacteria group bacterium Athens0714_12]
MANQKAIEIFYFLKNNPQEIQKELIKIFKNKNLLIKEIKLLKDKLIINEQYKITALLTLEKNLPDKIILEIHDNEDYFDRNLFALKELKKIKKFKIAVLYGFLAKLKIIIREYIKGDFFVDILSKKNLNFNQTKKIIEKFSQWLADLHNLKIKKSNKFLFKKLNQKIEEIILNRTIEFIKPNIESLTPLIKRNLRVLIKKTETIEKKNKACLIHGDFQPANFIKKNNSFYLTDFDTMEIGNPLRDLGRFLFQLDYFLKENGIFSSRQINELENLFIINYFNQRPTFDKNGYQLDLDIYKAQMIQYVILGKIWGERVPVAKKIKQFLSKQSKLLNL